METKAEAVAAGKDDRTTRENERREIRCTASGHTGGKFSFDDEEEGGTHDNEWPKREEEEKEEPTGPTTASVALLFPFVLRRPYVWIDREMEELTGAKGQQRGE